MCQFLVVEFLLIGSLVGSGSMPTVLATSILEEWIERRQKTLSFDGLQGRFC